jgi:hypothetical protein
VYIYFPGSKSDSSVTLPSLQTLYYNGAENFWVHGTGPLGCLPQKLAVPRANDSDIDSSGCLKPLNDGSYEFNNQLGSQLRGATIVYVDILAIKYELVANHSAYGELPTFLHQSPPHIDDDEELT